MEVFARNRNDPSSKDYEVFTPPNYDSENSVQTSSSASRFGANLHSALSKSTATTTPPLSPSVGPSRGPRPLILSNRRVTRDFSSSRQSSISSGRGIESDPTSSRVVPLRRHRIGNGARSPSPPVLRSRSGAVSPSSSAGETLQTKWRPTGPDQPRITPPALVEPSTVLSPSTLSNSAGPSTPVDSTSWPQDIMIKRDELSRLEMPPDDLSQDLDRISSSGTLRVSRLRTKRSLPPLQTPAPGQRTRGSVSDTSEDEHRKSQLTPRPFPGRHSPENLSRRKSSPRGRRIRKSSRGDHSNDGLETPVMISEEEGVKGDDEGEYDELIDAYSAEDVDSN